MDWDEGESFPSPLQGVAVWPRGRGRRQRFNPRRIESADEEPSASRIEAPVEGMRGGQPDGETPPPLYTAERAEELPLVEETNLAPGGTTITPEDTTTIPASVPGEATSAPEEVPPGPGGLTNIREGPSVFSR